MSGEIGSAYLSILPSLRGFGSKVESGVGGDIDRVSKRSGSRFGTVFASATVSPLRAIGAAAVGLFAVDKTVGFLKDSIAEARESQKVNALTTSTIKATGGAANVTAKQVGNLAGALSLKTGIDDETIQSGQNMLLTFKNIRNETGKGNDIFNQATKSLVDLSSAMGTEPKQAAIQLGKALNDPIKGVTALTRVGVTFDDQQKAQIKTLVASGKTADAQKIILKELNSEFGGAAAAQATAGDKFKTAFGNLQEAIGTALLPILDKALSGLTKFAIFLTNSIGPAFSAAAKFAAPFVTAIAGVFSSLAGGGGGASGALSGFLAFAKSIGSVVLPVLQAFGAYVTGSVIPFLKTVAQAFITYVLPAIGNIVRSVAGSLLPVFQSIGQVVTTEVLPALSSALNTIKPYVPTFLRVAGVVVTVLGSFTRFAAAVLGFVLPPLIKLVGFLLGGFIRTIAVVIATVGGLIRALISIGRGFAAAGRAVGSAMGLIRAAVARGVAAAIGIIRGVSAVAGIFSAAFGRARDAVSSSVGRVLAVVRGIPGRIKSSLGNLGGILLNAGRELISGLARGITEKIGDAINAVRDGVAKIKGLLPGSPIKWGPLKSWNNGGAGKRLMASLASGIVDGTDAPVSAMRSASASLSNAFAAGGSAGFAVNGGAGLGGFSGDLHLYDINGELIGSMQAIADAAVAVGGP